MTTVFPSDGQNMATMAQVAVPLERLGYQRFVAIVTIMAMDRPRRCAYRQVRRMSLFFTHA